MKVFINRIDHPVVEAVGHLLSSTIVGSHRPSEDEDEEAQQKQTDENGGETDQSTVAAAKKKKIPYQVVGSKSPVDKSQDDDLSVLKPYQVPYWVNSIVDVSSKELLQKELLDADVIIYDVTYQPEECAAAIEFLSESKEKYKHQPKTFICLSSIMTWAKTKTESEEGELSLTEEDFRKRKAHPNFKAHLQIEKDVIKNGKKGGALQTYVISTGIVYHGGQSIFHYFFKSAWHGVQELPCFGEGNNIIPLIHLTDLATIVTEVIEQKPETRYIVAVDDSKVTLYDVIKALSENLGTGMVCRMSKEEALLQSEIKQIDYDMLSVNVKIEPGMIKDLSIEWKYETGIVENMSSICKEYRSYWGLWPVKVFIHGPPASGKTFYGKVIAKEYKLHYISLDEVMSEAVSRLEKLATPPAQKEEESSEDERREQAKELLEEYKSAFAKNNQVYPNEYVMRFLKEKLHSMNCRNQGYVLDGFPTNADETQQLFQASADDDDQKEDSKVPPYDREGAPEFVIYLDCKDEFIKERIMKMPENQVADSQLQESTLTARLEAYRAKNTDENTLLNYFDEREIHPLILDLNLYNDDTNLVLSLIKKFIGEPHNYGPTKEEIIEKNRLEQEEKVKNEQLAEDEKQKRELEEKERHSKAVADWNVRLEDIRKQEKDVLESQSVPLRQYLMKNVMPTLTTALIEVCKARPDDPIDFLADYLFKSNANNVST